MAYNCYFTTHNPYSWAHLSENTDSGSYLQTLLIRRMSLPEFVSVADSRLLARDKGYGICSVWQAISPSSRRLASWILLCVDRMDTPYPLHNFTSWSFLYIFTNPDVPCFSAKTTRLRWLVVFPGLLSFAIRSNGMESFLTAATCCRWRTLFLCSEVLFSW